MKRTFSAQSDLVGWALKALLRKKFCRNASPLPSHSPRLVKHTPKYKMTVKKNKGFVTEFSRAVPEYLEVIPVSETSAKHNPSDLSEKVRESSL